MICYNDVLERRDIMFQLFKRILNMNFKKYIISFIFLIVYYIFKLLPPFYIGIIVDAIANQSMDYHNFIQITILLLVTPITMYVACMIWGYNLYKAAGEIDNQLKKQIMKHYLSMFPNFFEKYSAGSLMGRITNDLASIEEYSGFGIMTLFDGYVYPIFVVSLMIFTSNILLTIISLIPLAIMAYLSTIVGKKFEKRDEAIKVSFDKMNDAVLLYASGIQTIRSYNLTQKMYDVYNEASIEYQFAVDQYYKLFSLYLVIGQLMPTLSIVFTLILGFYYISIGNMTIGSLLSFMVYVRYLEWPMSALANSIGQQMSAKVSLARLDEVFNETPLLESGIKPISKIEEVEFKNFDYQVGELKILENINLKFKAGDFIGVVGKTGSGKTTLLKQLLRFNEVEKNQILINHLSIEHYNIEELRSLISYVPQEHMLFSKTIKENIEFGTPVEDFNQILVQADLKKDIESFIDKENTVVGEKGIMLSGGQKQRISLARALAKNRPFYILDDCLSALDNETQENILIHLRNNTTDKTLFIASHRLSIFAHATKIIVLDEGKIIESGTHEELLANNGWYKEQYEYQKAGDNNE